MKYTDSQLDAIKSDDGNVLVSASAGSGKTSVMIERIVRLITEKKATVNEILAVTFTESAGAEMKEKLKSALIEKINEGDDSLIAQLNDVRLADICTIDSFCSRLIRSYFFEVGIAPDYEICDENRGGELKTEAINEVFRKHYHDKGDFLKFVDRYAIKRNDGPLRSIILEMYDKLSTEADIDGCIERYKNITFDNALLELLNDLKDRANKIRDELIENSLFIDSYELPKGKQIIAELMIDCDYLLKSNSIYDVFKMISKDRKFSFDKTTDESILEVKEKIHKLKTELSNIAKKDYTAYLTNYEDDKVKFEDAKNSQSFFFEITKEFKECYDRLKREENLLDFSDLEHFALYILKNDALLTQIKGKYKYIFIDEYQDVNGIQEELITTLSNDNLFMVGDEKQSIYGFRGCRPEFFNEKYTKLKNEGENKAKKLNDNFRSSKSVVDAVNTIFSYSMTEKNYGLNYNSEACLVYGNGFKEYDGRANLHILYKDKVKSEGEKARVYDIKEEVFRENNDEDNLTVSLLTNIINEELQKEYYSVKENSLKKVTFSDIVILSRNKNGAYIDGIIKGLIAHGINVSASAEEDICEYPEVKRAINFLRLVDCFYQDIPLVSVLKSKICCCSENDLALINEFYKLNAKNDSDYYSSTFVDAFLYYIKNGDGTLKDRLVEFYGYFENIRFVADFSTAGEVLEKVIDDFNLYPLILAGNCGDIKVARLKRLVSYCNEKALSIKALLRQVDSGDKKITISQSGDENSVRVMTIHASKGLEFPVVILCGMEKAFNKDDIKGDMLFYRDSGFAFKSFNDDSRTCSENVFRKLLKIKLTKQAEREEARLLYVALTRASYALHMTAVVSDDKRSDKFDGANCYLDFIPSAFPVREYRNDSLGFVNIKKDRRQVIISQETSTGTLEMQKKFAFKYGYLNDTLLPLKSNVTEANTMSEEENLPVLFIERENSSKAEQGIIAHKIMQYYDFNNKDFDFQINKMITDNIITKAEVDSINLESIRAVCLSEQFSNFASKKIYREQGFICKINSKMIFGNKGSDSEILLQGVLDLLVIDGDNAEIIDYKYSGKNRDELINEYRKQLELYAFAVESVLNKKVTKKTIISLLTGKRVEID